MSERVTAAGIVGILGGGINRAINNRQNARNILDAARIQGEYGVVRTHIENQYAAEAQQREHESLLAVTRANNEAKLDELGLTQPHQIAMKKLDQAHELEKLKTESELRVGEGSAKAADEMRLTVIKGQEERKTTSTAVMQENQRLKNLQAAGISPDTISELGTKSGTTDLRMRKYKPEVASPEDFSEAPAPTPGTGAQSRGATLNEHFGADTGVTPAGSPKPAAAAPVAEATPVDTTATTPEPVADPEPAKPAKPVKPVAPLADRSKPAKVSNTNNWELETDPEVIKASFHGGKDYWGKPVKGYDNIEHNDSRVRAIVREDGSWSVTSAHYPNISAGPGLSTQEEAIDKVASHIAQYHRGVLGEQNVVSNNFLTKPKLKNRPLLGTTSTAPLSGGEIEKDDEEDVSHETSTSESVAAPAETPVIPTIAKPVSKPAAKPAAIRTGAVTSKYATAETNPGPNFKVKISPSLTSFEDPEQFSIDRTVRGTPSSRAGQLGLQKKKAEGTKKAFLISKMDEYHPLPSDADRARMTPAAHQKAVDEVFKNRKQWLASSMKTNIDHMLTSNDSNA